MCRQKSGKPPSDWHKSAVKKRMRNHMHWWWFHLARSRYPQGGGPRSGGQKFERHRYFNVPSPTPSDSLTPATLPSFLPQLHHCDWPSNGQRYMALWDPTVPCIHSTRLEMLRRCENKLATESAEEVTAQLQQEVQVRVKTVLGGVKASPRVLENSVRALGWGESKYFWLGIFVLNIP